MVSTGVAVAGVAQRSELSMLLRKPARLLRGRRLKECRWRLVHIGAIGRRRGQGDGR